MVKIGESNDDIDRWVEEGLKQFSADALTPLNAHGNPKTPGFLTVAQASALYVAVQNHQNPGSTSTSISNAVADYVRLACLDIASCRLKAIHPLTKLSWRTYLAIIKRGMYGDDEIKPSVGLDWLVAVRDVERWYRSKGIQLNLSALSVEPNGILAPLGAESSVIKDAKNVVRRKSGSCSPDAAWSVKKPKRADALSNWTYEALKDAKTHGGALPRPYDIFCWIQKNKKLDGISIDVSQNLTYINGNGIKEHISLKNMNLRIRRMIETTG